MTKPIVHKQFLVRINNDLTYTIGHYFDKQDYKKALKEKGVRDAVAMTAPSTEEIEKFAKEYIENIKEIDKKIEEAVKEMLKKEEPKQETND